MDRDRFHLGLLFTQKSSSANHWSSIYYHCTRQLQLGVWCTSHQCYVPTIRHRYLYSYAAMDNPTFPMKFGRSPGGPDGVKYSNQPQIHCDVTKYTSGKPPLNTRIWRRFLSDLRCIVFTRQIYSPSSKGPPEEKQTFPNSNFPFSLASNKIISWNQYYFQGFPLASNTIHLKYTSQIQ